MVKDIVNVPKPLYDKNLAEANRKFETQYPNFRTKSPLELSKKISDIKVAPGMTQREFEAELKNWLDSQPNAKDPSIIEQIKSKFALGDLRAKNYFDLYQKGWWDVNY